MGNVFYYPLRTEVFTNYTRNFNSCTTSNSLSPLQKPVS